MPTTSPPDAPAMLRITSLETVDADTPYAAGETIARAIARDALAQAGPAVALEILAGLLGGVVLCLQATQGRDFAATALRTACAAMGERLDTIAAGASAAHH